LKTGRDLNGPQIAITRVPVMYRLLGKIRPAQKQQDSTRATAIDAAPEKGKPVGKPAAGAVEGTIALTYLGGQ
jgi:hypothetical protein